MSHWYTIDGSPSHTIVGKNGKERNVNLRDARKLNLFPSVTTVMSVLDKPGLNIWKLDQLALSMLTLPKIDGETLEAFKERAKKDSMEQVKDAANVGSEIHAAIEVYYKTGDYTGKYQDSVSAVVAAIEKHTGITEGWIAEQRFSCEYGYGGMVDLHNSEWVIDFKTKDGDQEAIGKTRLYDDHFLQLSAYAYGLGLPSAKRMNVFISRNNPGAIKLIEHDKCYFDRFEALVRYWQLSKNFTPKYAH